MLIKICVVLFLLYDNEPDRARRSDNGEAIRGSDSSRAKWGSAKSGVAPMTASFRCLLSPRFTLSSDFSNLDPRFLKIFKSGNSPKIKIR